LYGQSRQMNLLSRVGSTRAAWAHHAISGLQQGGVNRKPPAAKTPGMCKSVQDKSLSATNHKREKGDPSCRAVMRAMAESSADAYAPLSARSYRDRHVSRPALPKADRLAPNQQTENNRTRAAPHELLSAEMCLFWANGDDVAHESRPGGNPISTPPPCGWKRDGRWQICSSI